MSLMLLAWRLSLAPMPTLHSGVECLELCRPGHSLAQFLSLVAWQRLLSPYLFLLPDSDPRCYLMYLFFFCLTNGRQCMTAVHLA